MMKKENLNFGDFLETVALDYYIRIKVSDYKIYFNCASASPISNSGVFLFFKDPLNRYLNVFPLSDDGLYRYIQFRTNYLLDENSTMQDLIDKAGGVTDKADTRAFLPGAIVEKSVQYYIPPRYNPTDICATEELQKVNINSYIDPEELGFIEGIGNTISQSIIDYRNENGLYQTLEDIMKVNGIGNATYTKLRNYIILVD